MFYRSHNRVTLNTGTQLMTKQSHKDECDIHRILKQYQRTGIITHVQNARPQYTDLPSSPDLQEALNTIHEADQAFSALPARVRAHFNNDPVEFLASFHDAKQHDQLREFGLLNPKEPPKATPPANDQADPPGTPQRA